MTSDCPLISVVVPAYNEEKYLTNCLDSLVNQDFTYPYEIIVVDNASTDKTSQIAQKYPIRLLHESQKGQVYALETGYRQSRGEIIAFTDADTIVPRHWLSTIYHHLYNDPDTGAIGGNAQVISRSSRIRFWGNFFYRHPFILCGANMAVRRNILQQIGGIIPSTEVNNDWLTTDRIRKVSQVKIDYHLTVYTSARRIEKNPIRGYLNYQLNYLYLQLIKKPLIHSRPDIR